MNSKMFLDLVGCSDFKLEINLNTSFQIIHNFQWTKTVSKKWKFWNTKKNKIISKADDEKIGENMKDQ